MTRVPVAGALALPVVAAPLALALADPHLGAAPLALVVSTGSGALAVSALALQGLLVARLAPVRRALRGREVRWHRAVGIGLLTLVLVHVGALFAVNVDDTLFTLSPDGPTRSRMALLATIGLAVAAAVALLPRRRGLPRGERRAVHVFAAVLAIVMGIGHAVWTQGALDGPGTVVLLGCGAMGLGGTAAAVAARARRTR